MYSNWTIVYDILNLVKFPVLLLRLIRFILKTPIACVQKFTSKEAALIERSVKDLWYNYQMYSKSGANAVLFISNKAACQWSWTLQWTFTFCLPLSESITVSCIGYEPFTETETHFFIHSKFVYWNGYDRFPNDTSSPNLVLILFHYSNHYLFA